MDKQKLSYINLFSSPKTQKVWDLLRKCMFGQILEFCSYHSKLKKLSFEWWKPETRFCCVQVGFFNGKIVALVGRTTMCCHVILIETVGAGFIFFVSFLFFSVAHSHLFFSHSHSTTHPHSFTTSLPPLTFLPLKNLVHPKLRSCPAEEDLSSWRHKLIEGHDLSLAVCSANFGSDQRTRSLSLLHTIDAVMVWLAIFSLCCALIGINFVTIKSRVNGNMEYIVNLITMHVVWYKSIAKALIFSNFYLQLQATEAMVGGWLLNYYLRLLA